MKVSAKPKGLLIEIRYYSYTRPLSGIKTKKICKPKSEMYKKENPRTPNESGRRPSTLAKEAAKVGNLLEITNLIFS